jgi:hypothetical protein
VKLRGPVCAREPVPVAGALERVADDEDGAGDGAHRERREEREHDDLAEHSHGLAGAVVLLVGPSDGVALGALLRKPLARALVLRVRVVSVDLQAATGSFVPAFDRLADLAQRLGGLVGP